MAHRPTNVEPVDHSDHQDSDEPEDEDEDDADLEMEDSIAMCNMAW